MPVGARSTKFAIGSSNVSATAVRRVIAVYGESQRVIPITLVPSPRLVGFSIAPSQLIGGGMVQVIVGLEGTHHDMPPVRIEFESSGPGINLPSSYLIDAMGYMYVGVRTSQVTAATVRNVKVKLAGMTLNQQVTLFPQPILKRFSISPTEVKGGQLSFGQIELSNPPDSWGGLEVFPVVDIISYSSAVIVPSEISILEGSASEGFAIETRPVSTIAVRRIDARQGNIAKSVWITLKP